MLVVRTMRCCHGSLATWAERRQRGPYSRLTRRAALASGGAGLASALLDRVDLERAWSRPPRTPHPPAGQRRRQSAAGRARLDADAGRPLLGLRRAGSRPRRAWSGWRPTRTSASPPWRSCTARSRPTPSSTRSTSGASRPSTRAEHRLLVHGLVERPTLFTMDDLKRFPSVSVIHFLECAGNSFSEWQEASMRPTVQLSHGLDQLRRMDRGAGRHHPARGRASSRVAAGCWPRGPMPRGTTAASRPPRRCRWAARLRRQRRGPAALSGLSRCACCCPASRGT